LHDAVSGIRQAVKDGFNKSVVAVKPTDERFNLFNGISYGNAVYVNTSADVGFVNITGHELYHQLAKDCIIPIVLNAAICMNYRMIFQMNQRAGGFFVHLCK
jgi:hypothetical protein